METIIALAFLGGMIFLFGFIAKKETERAEKYRQDLLSAIRDIGNSLKDN